MAMSNRKVISRHLLSWQTFWSSRSVWRKKCNNCFRRPFFTWPFQIRWVQQRWWLLLCVCVFPISEASILEIVITSVVLALGRTKFHEPEKHQNLLRKTFVLSSACHPFLQKHKAESRPEIHWLHQEWGSDYFPMNSSTQLVCEVCDSQLFLKFQCQI